MIGDVLLTIVIADQAIARFPRCLGASSTVHDRFQLWVEQGVFERMWELGLEQYAGEVGIDWEWMAMDGAMVKAPLGGKINWS